jgi:hypothetical protein
VSDCTLTHRASLLYSNCLTVDLSVQKLHQVRLPNAPCGYARVVACRREPFFVEHSDCPPEHARRGSLSSWMHACGIATRPKRPLRVALVTFSRVHSSNIPSMQTSSHIVKICRLPSSHCMLSAMIRGFIRRCWSSPPPPRISIYTVSCLITRLALRVTAEESCV